jgi:hypothetical protein
VGRCGRRPRGWQQTTIPDPAAAARAELVRRDCAVNAAAVTTRLVGRHHLCPDLGRLAVAGDGDRHRLAPGGRVALAGHLRPEVVADALANAVARDPKPGGSSFGQGLPRHQRRGRHPAGGLEVALSTGRTGPCWDNALAESCCAWLKASASTSSLARPSGHPPRHRGRHRLVQRHPAPQRPRRSDPNEFDATTKKQVIEQLARPSHQPCPSKRGNPTCSAGQHRHATQMRMG